MYQYKDHVRFSQVGEDRRMRLDAMVDAMQDCSCLHSESIGVGRDFLAPRHRAWLLNSWQIIIDRVPLENDEYTSETRPWKFERFYGNRNFALIDSQGEYFLRANSVWFYVDTEKMLPVRPTAEDIDPYGVDEPLKMDYAKVRRLKLPEQMEEQESFPVRRADLDANHHVNNGKYIRMAEEYFPEGKELRELWVEYRTAAKYGDRICPKTGIDQDGRFTIALCADDGEVYAIVKAMFREA